MGGNNAPTKDRKYRDRPDVVAGNGLLDRRALLRGGAGIGRRDGLHARRRSIGRSAADRALDADSGSACHATPTASRISNTILPRGSRAMSCAAGSARKDNINIPEVGTVRTPHHLLTGTITPSGLHFTRLHTGIPDIDPAKHRLLIHGLVKRPLIFDLETLARYPMESHIYFLECGGNSELMYDEHPAQVGRAAAAWPGLLLRMDRRDGSRC